MLHATHNCPVCDGHSLSLLHPLWQNRNSIAAFKLHSDRYFASCERCGTIFRFPLINYDDTNVYGKEYYEVPDIDASQYIEGHVAQHQKHNYESIVGLMREEFPAQHYPKWLDVGSVGYPTTFKDYSFDTIEPSRKAVEQGRLMFGSQRIFQGTIETYKTAAPYDGLLFNNSFYCLPSPRSSLSRCRDLLVEEGVIVITLATYLNGATQDSGDGNVDRVEDFICGDTLHVYYNEFSLRYLLESAGFSFLSSRKLPAYGHKNMIAYMFKKSASPISQDAKLLDQARAYMNDRLVSAFVGFERETVDCLNAIDTQETVLYGELGLIRELCSIRKMHNILGIIPTDIAVPSGVTLDGMAVTDIEYVRSISEKNSKLRIVIVSFTSARQLATSLTAQLGGAKCEIYMPSRSSALASIRFEFGNTLRMSKAFRLIKVDLSAFGTTSETHQAQISEGNAGSRRNYVSRLIQRLLRM